jgi:hypothetical protein
MAELYAVDVPGSVLSQWHMNSHWTEPVGIKHAQRVQYDHSRP